MRQPVRFLVIAVLVSTGLGTLVGSSAWAISAFHTGFVNQYVKKESTEPVDQAFAELVTKARCYICHVNEERTERNTYGQALDKLLDQKTDARNRKKIQEALLAVEKERSDPKDPKSPTFGERLQARKLPVEITPEIWEKAQKEFGEE